MSKSPPSTSSPNSAPFTTGMSKSPAITPNERNRSILPTAIMPAPIPLTRSFLINIGRATPRATLPPATAFGFFVAMSPTNLFAYPARAAPATIPAIFVKSMLRTAPSPDIRRCERERRRLCFLFLAICLCFCFWFFEFNSNNNLLHFQFLQLVFRLLLCLMFLFEFLLSVCPLF